MLTIADFQFSLATFQKFFLSEQSESVLNFLWLLFFLSVSFLLVERVALSRFPIVKGVALDVIEYCLMSHSSVVNGEVRQFWHGEIA